MGQVEQQSCLKWTLLLALWGLPFGIVIQTESIVATSLKNVIIVVISLSQQLVINVDSLSILPHVEIAVCEPKTVLYLDVDVPLTLEQCHGSNPVSLLDVILKGRHFLLLDFVMLEIFAWNFGNLCFRYWRSWTIHSWSCSIEELFKFFVIYKFEILANVLFYRLLHFYFPLTKMYKTYKNWQKIMQCAVEKHCL